MLRYIFDLSKTEIFLLIALAIAGCYLLVFAGLRKKDSKKPTLEKNPEAKNPKGKKGPGQNLQVVEIFDYNGIKILHQDGSYTVNDSGVVTSYSTWNSMPFKYQKMIKELDNRSLGEKGSDYFLEMINGFYYVSLPGGRKKRYDSIKDIPPDIRKRLGV